MNLWPSSSRPYLCAARVSWLLLILSHAPGVLAQQPPPPPDDVRELVEQLRKQVAELEARTKELEARLNKDAAPTPTPTPEATALKPAQAEPELAKEDSQATPSTMNHAGHGGGLIGTPLMQIHGFSDVNFRASNVKGQTNTFALGQLALFVNSRLSDKMNVLAEMAFEMEEDNGLGFDLERILLQYAVNDYFNLNVGRYHTAIGYYNTAFHHGTWFQTATGRPFMFRFEDDGGILPTHNVGVSVNGRIPSGDLRLSYVAEIGNGRASRSKLDEAVQNKIDENNGKAFNLALQSRPRWAPGLQVGVSMYRDRLTPENLPKIGETIWAAHAVYQTPSFEFLNEGILIRHNLAGTHQTLNTPAFYTQISRRFYNKLRPYFRYEYLNAPESDPLIGDVGRRHGPSLGVRYDLGEFAAFKLQYDRLSRRAQSASNALQLQFAFTF
jgi:hypothetical protein